MVNIRSFCIVLCFGLVSVLQARAQNDPGPCDTCWSGYVYDSSLSMIGHQVTDFAVAAADFHFNGSQTYAQDLTARLELLDADDHIVWVADSSHPWGGWWNDTAIDPSRAEALATGEFGAIRDALLKRGMEDALERGMTLTGIPNPVKNLSDDALRTENYLVMPPEFQYYQLKEFPQQNMGAEWMRQNLTPLEGGFFWSYRVNGSLTPDTALMAGRPEWNREVFPGAASVLSDPDALKFTYDQVYRIWHDEDGDPRDSATADSLAALYDRRTWFDVGFAMWADQDSLADNGIGNNAVIAYADLFVRDLLAQPGAGDTCFCNILRRIGRFEITKADYLARFNEEGEVHVAHKNGSLDRGNWYFELDTLIDFTPWLPTVSNFAGWGTDPNSVQVIYDSLGAPIDTVPHPWALLCDSIVDARLALSPLHAHYLPPGSYSAVPDDDADFSWRFYSTRIVPVGFLRGSVANHLYAAIRDGDADSAIARAVASIYADPRIDSLVGRVGVDDEPNNRTFRTMGLLSAKIQRAIKAHPIGANRPKPVWTNPQGNHYGFRLMTGDLDSTSFKQVHVAARQVYGINGGDPTPITYANPDSLGTEAWYVSYRAGEIRDSLRYIIDTVSGDTTAIDTVYTDRRVAGNNPEDYGRYLDVVQTKFFGTFRQKDDISQDGTVSGTARLADVMRFKYRDRFPNIPSTPVWNVVQTFGWIGAPGETQADYFRSWRTPTPEEMIAQSWLSVASGASGLVFGDFQYDGFNVGLLTDHILDPSWYDRLEYGMNRSSNQQTFGDDNPNYRIDSMWLGFRSRQAAIREVTGDLYYLDTTLGLRNLEFAQEQMSVYDTVQSFDEIPLLDDLKTERAKQYDVTFDSVTGNALFVGSDTLDARAETYMEVTHFRVLPGAGAAFQEGARVMMFVNRRCWPLDLNAYGDSAESRFAQLAPFSAFGTVGLGAIDVRRPVVVFENSTDVIADHLIVEKISPSDHWIDTVAFGDTVRLPWHLPGRGAVYLLTPIPALLSDLGTAYNNAVHSENPSSDTLARDRMVVYQRDSVVYIRSIDSAGAWSAEVMLSDPADTAVVNGKRIASAFFPALATCRNNEGATRAVWERRDTLGRHSVESIVLFQNPITRLNLAAVVDSFSSRHQLLPPSYPEGTPNLTPAIVGVHDTAGTGGFVVAWAGPDTGVTVLAIREIPDGTDFLAWQDTVSVRRLHANVPLDSVCQYPTLAHVPRFERMNGSTARLAGSDPEKETDPLTEESLYWLNRVHLAYQQGDGDEGVGEQIYYHPVGVIFPDQTLFPPGLLVGWAEPVTRKIAACSFVHPSIAADSARVGVAFEIVESNAGQRNIGLRFRDTAGSNLGAPLKAWETTLYRWGGPLTRVQKMFGLGAVYERPSLAEFPSMDSLSLAFSPEGGLTWYWSNGPTGRAFPQWLYRYGWFGPREIGDGKHPGMMLVPYVGSNPFEETGIFHRGTDSSRVAGVNDVGDPVWRYASRLLNTPGNPIGYFSTITGGSGIIAGATVAASPSGCNVQRRMDFGIVFSHGSVTHPVDDHFPPVDPPVPPSKPGLPPTFFASPGGGTTLVDTLSTAWQVVRTGLFATGNEPVAIRRIAAGGDSLSEWLDTYGWDTARSVPANVWAVLELVRAADSVVLWRSDTIDARGLDTLEDPLDAVLGVPVNTAADSGTIAFIRMECFATEKVVYDLHGGFRFYTEDSTVGGFEKVSRPRIEEESRATTGASRLSVLVLPNPARDRAEVRVRVAAGGQVRLSVWSMRGERLAVLPDLAAEDGGEYSVEISLAAVPAGTYLLRAETADSETSLRFNVVR